MSKIRNDGRSVALNRFRPQSSGLVGDERSRTTLLAGRNTVHNGFV